MQSIAEAVVAEQMKNLQKETHHLNGADPGNGRCTGNVHPAVCALPGLRTPGWIAVIYLILSSASRWIWRSSVGRGKKKRKDEPDGFHKILPRAAQCRFHRRTRKPGEVLAWVGGVNHEFFNTTTSCRRVRWVYLQAYCLCNCPAKRHSTLFLLRQPTPGISAIRILDAQERHQRLWRVLFPGRQADQQRQYRDRSTDDAGAPQNVARLAKELGITEVPPVPAIALGAVDVSLRDMDYTVLLLRGEHALNSIIYAG